MPPEKGIFCFLGILKLPESKYIKNDLAQGFCEEKRAGQPI
jgi:hypothetical protein